MLSPWQRRRPVRTADGAAPPDVLCCFQACTEINLCYDSNNETDMFPPMTFGETERHAYCSQRWAVRPRPRWLQTQFWGDGEQQPR